MSTANLEKVLREARKLPLHAQTELVKALLSEVAESLVKVKRPKTGKPSGETFSAMSIGELQALSVATLAPNRQRRLRLLLRKNEAGTLSDNQRKELDEILEESDRLALLKAKAKYTLLMSQYARGASM